MVLALPLFYCCPCLDMRISHISFVLQIAEGKHWDWQDVYCVEPCQRGGLAN